MKLGSVAREGCESRRNSEDGRWRMENGEGATSPRPTPPLRGGEGVKRRASSFPSFASVKVVNVTPSAVQRAVSFSESVLRRLTRAQVGGGVLFQSMRRVALSPPQRARQRSQSHSGCE